VGEWGTHHWNFSAKGKSKHSPPSAIKHTQPKGKKKLAETLEMVDKALDKRAPDETGGGNPGPPRGSKKVHGATGGEGPIKSPMKKKDPERP